MEKRKPLLFSQEKCIQVLYFLEKENSKIAGRYATRGPAGVCIQSNNKENIKASSDGPFVKGIYRLRLRQCLFNQNRYRYHIRFTRNTPIYNNHIFLIYNESNARWETSIKVISDRWHGGHPERKSMRTQWDNTQCNFLTMECVPRLYNWPVETPTKGQWWTKHLNVMMSFCWCYNIFKHL